MRLNILRRLSLIVAIAALMSVAADASTLTYTASLPGLDFTDIIDAPLSIQQFDTLGGSRVLTQVRITLNGEVDGNAKFENTGNSATVSMHLQATLTLTDLLGNVLVVTIPTANTLDVVPRYDGIDDFGGPSGRSYLGLRGTASQSVTLTAISNPTELALFTGTGSIILPLDAVGTSTASGSGNLDLKFTTEAVGDISVSYDYVAPEPATLAMFGSALVGLGLMGRKRLIR